MQTTGQAYHWHSCTLEAEHWSGVSDGERWTESSLSDRALLSMVSAGTYALRLAPLTSVELGPAKNVGYTISVVSDVPSTGKPLTLLALSLFPLLWIDVRRLTFERKRWSESDHG